MTQIKLMNSVNKRIYILGSLELGGEPRVIVEAANGLAACGWKVTVVVVNLDKAVYQQDLDQSIRLVNLNKKCVRNSFFSLRSFIKKEKPEKILAHSEELGVYLLRVRATLQHQFKIIACVGISLKKIQRKRLSLYRYLVVHHIYLLMRKLDYIITPSKGLQQELIEDYKIKPERITVIYNPVDLSIKEYQKKLKRGSNPTHKEILFSGRLVHQKRVDFLIRAFAKCLAQRNDIHLRIIGTGVLQSALEKLVKELAIDNYVTFEGFKRDVGQFYFNADATVLASSQEGFGNVLLESISVGTPIVAVDCPHGPNEIVVEGINGYLVPMNDMEGLVQKILKVLDTDFPPEQVKKTALRFERKAIISHYQQVIENV